MAVILVVDDLAINRQFLVTLLSYGGHQLVEASDGAEALKRIQEMRPDLVICDILMPNMDGYEFVKHMHKHADTTAIPIIFYTALYREKEVQALAQACHVNWILTKPAEPTHIIQTVHLALGGAEKTAQLSSLPRANTGHPRYNDQLLEFREQLEAANHLMEKLAYESSMNSGDRMRLLRTVTRLNDSFCSMQGVCLRLEALVELGLNLAEIREPLQLMEMVCRAAQGNCAAKFAALGILDETGDRMRYFVSRGFSDAEVQVLSAMNPRSGVFQTLINQQKPHRLQNSDGLAFALALPIAHPPLQSFLGIAIRSKQRIYGWLYVAEKFGDSGFSDMDCQWVITMAAQLATAYENLRLIEKMLTKALP